MILAFEYYFAVSNLYSNASEKPRNSTIRDEQNEGFYGQGKQL
jgi:hypothetical protein